MRAVFHRRPRPGARAARTVFSWTGAWMAILLFGGALSGCATAPPASDPEAVAEFRQTNDPIEPTNRVFYKINTGLDTVILKPAAQAYQYVVPGQVRDPVRAEDFAPTMAALLGVELADVDGRPLGVCTVGTVPDSPRR